MPYQTISELPPNMQNVLPEHAIHIYRDAFNSAWDEYKDPSSRRDPEESREEVAYRVALAAIKHKYHKNTKSGIWESIKK